jgi:hypothetical protein
MRSVRAARYVVDADRWSLATGDPAPEIDRIAPRRRRSTTGRDQIGIGKVPAAVLATATGAIWACTAALLSDELADLHQAGVLTARVSRTTSHMVCTALRGRGLRWAGLRGAQIRAGRLHARRADH